MEDHLRSMTVLLNECVLLLCVVVVVTTLFIADVVAGSSVELTVLQALL